MTTPKSAPSSEQLEAAYRNLDRVITFVNHADNKALIFLTFDGVFAALLAANAGSIASTFAAQRAANWQTAIVAASICFLVFFFASLLTLLQALFPDIAERKRDGSRGSLFFFVTISKMSLQEYERSFSQMDGATIEAELLEQTRANAIVATRKFKDLRRSVYLLLFAFMSLIVAISAIILSSAPGIGS